MGGCDELCATAPHDLSSPEALPQPPLIPCAVLYTYVRCACSVRVRDGPDGLGGAAAAAAELQGRADGAEEVVLATADGAPPPPPRAQDRTTSTTAVDAVKGLFFHLSPG